MMKSELFTRLQVLAMPKKRKAQPVHGATEHLNLLYTFIAVRYFEGLEDPVKAKYSQLTTWYKQAETFLDQYDLAKRPYRIVLRMIKAKTVENQEFDSELDTIVDELRPNMKLIRQRVELSEEQIAAYNAGYRMLNRPTERNLDLATRAVGNLDNQLLNEWYSEPIDSQKDIVEELSFLVSKILGKKRPTMTIEEGNQARKEKPKRYKQYLALRRQASTLYKQALRSLVRSSNKRLIDAKKAKKDLENSGVTLHGIPKGFVGTISEDGKLHTSAGKELKQQPPQNATITMNSKYDPKADNGHYLKYTVPGTAGKIQHAFTLDWDRRRTQQRDDRVFNMADTVNSARKKWLADLKGQDHDKMLLGLMVELLYTFQIRSGSSKNITAGKRTFGLTTLQGKHIQNKGKNLIIKYSGKSGVPQLHQIKPQSSINKLVIKQLLGLRSDKEEYIFLLENGKRVGARTLNQYIKSKGLDVTAKDFRRLQGKVLMEEYFEKNPLPKDATQTQVNTYLKNGALEVGKALGHRRGVKTGGKEAEYTSSTAINSYIPSVILKSLYEQRGLRVPKFLTKKLGRTPTVNGEDS